MTINYNVMQLLGYIVMGCSGCYVTVYVISELIDWNVKRKMATFVPNDSRPPPPPPPTPYRSPGFLPEEIKVAPILSKKEKVPMKQNQKQALAFLFLGLFAASMLLPLGFFWHSMTNEMAGFATVAAIVMFFCTMKAVVGFFSIKLD